VIHPFGGKNALAAVAAVAQPWNVFQQVHDPGNPLYPPRTLEEPRPTHEFDRLFDHAVGQPFLVFAVACPCV